MSDHTRTLGPSDTLSSREMPRGVRLVVLEGPDRGLSVQVDLGTSVIGTLSGCELVLRDDSVSRRHVALEVLSRRVRIRDLGSKNGTRYLGARVTEVEVPIGAVLELGQTRVMILPKEAGPERLSDRTELQGLLGRSPAMRRLFAQIERVAPTDAPVLIGGESGTGKEGVARALHALSDRAEGPLEIFDCASVSPQLVHSALFGHVKGAFTGADRDAPGALVRAHGGTLFLDEIGELPLELQPSLLRAVQTQTFTPVGDRQTRRVDFRIIAATHRDLEAEVRAGRFREDLFHRLGSIILRVPPLRERLEDVPLLAAHFLSEGGAQGSLPPEALTALTSWRWPGNVRELRNAVLRVTALGTTEALLGKDLSAAAAGGQGPVDFAAARDRALRTFEYNYLKDLLERHQGSSTAAAREAGIARSYFFRLLAEHGLKGHGRKDR